MSARHAAQIENLAGGLLMAMLVAGENGRARAVAREQDRREIIAHNAAVARARVVRRRRDAAIAQQVAVGEARMARWLDRVAHSGSVKSPENCLNPR